MKMKQASPRLQPLTPSDREYVLSLAAEHSQGMEQRCARYRRRAKTRRVAVAACLVVVFAFGADSAYGHPPLYTEINSSGSVDSEQICYTIETILNQL